MNINPMKKYSELQNLIERADRLICLKATGTAEEFADKLGVSRATVVRLLQYLREIGKPVKYCKYRKAYYYE
jgi:biotin operon repressor